MSEIGRLKPIKKARIGLYSGGLKAYWSQFEGMKERLIEYGKFIENNLSELGEVYNFGLVDDEITGRTAGEWFNEKNVDIIFSHSATYYTSSTVLPLHQICKAPVILLNLQPTPQMNYAKTSTGEWLAHCGACPVPEIANAFNRAGIKCKIINGLLGLKETPSISVADEVTYNRPEAIKAWKEINEWAMAATVKRTLQHARFGFLGNNYSGMLDMYSDFTMLQAQLGIHVEILEMCDLDRNLNQVTDEEIAAKVKQVEEFFVISGDSPSDPIAKKPTKEQLEWACKVAAAQERMVKEYDLDGIAYYYHGSDDNHYEQVQGAFIVGHSLLTAAGVPCAGEGDLKTAIAMKICDTLKKGGSFTEIVAVDYIEETIILGHDGPFHIKISDGKPVLRGMGVFHGKKGTGVSVEANVISGPVTTLGVTQTHNGKVKFNISEGDAVKAPILMIGNTQTHVKFPLHPDRYMDKWFAEAPTHHCAMSVGHNAALFEKIAYILDIHQAII
ncbi:L-fucose/L-arabinose isomerase family protein [Cellulosilyticum sp. I15G10I2]|uniref:L-fucose/L-arabinose isomerase family protein n=1 Tax=Cellulosilyticum sp. I15G10I2 TaxID=1892843 RepID=UPI00085CCE86|nr:L-fucose/L-arabinose isomerase family protein [Cellulosilyticum sp. I15G10I2]